MYYPVSTPIWIQRLFASSVWSVAPKATKTIYLTFDDGPVPPVTNWVLEQLATYHAKATFFCVGANVKKHPLLYQKIVEEGHVVGNHTYSHQNGWKLSTQKYLDEVHLCSQYVSSKLFRPPYGKLRPLQYHRLKQHYKIIMWDVIAGDFDSTISAQKCLDNVLQHTQDGSIVVLHDSIKASGHLKYVLPRLLQHFTNKGYVFSSLDVDRI